MSVGVPLIVIRLADQLAVTPAGSPMGVPMPVAPEDTMIILVSGVLTQRVGVEDGIPIVFLLITVMVPVA